MNKKTILVWFRKDLRVHDNEILIESIRKADQIIPVYCFDPRHFQLTSFNTLKTGYLRANFLLESVADLKKSLQNMGGELLLAHGKPEDILPELVSRYSIQEVYHHREVASEETKLSADVERALWKQKVNLKHFIGHTLFHKEDLPFPINSIPNVFNTFRKKIERDSFVKTCYESPVIITVPNDVEWGTMPTLNQLGYNGHNAELEKGIIHFKGGESEAMLRMKHFFWDTDAILSYKQTHSLISGADYSSKFSAWISMGCLSPREVYWELRKYQKARGAGDFAHSFFLELLYRDFFRFMFKKHGNIFFQKEGFKTVSPSESEMQIQHFEEWKSANTQQPLVDALMHELNSTGYISSSGRQVVATYLVHDLHVNWTWGAAYFEERLIDYDPASNWGNWAFVAGVGTDPKFMKQDAASKTDSDSIKNYISKWLPKVKEKTTT